MKGRCGCLLLALLLLATGGANAQSTYVDAVDHPGISDGWGAYLDLRNRLEHDFDQICGDTFCEGEYSDYKPLRYRCSVELATGLVEQCTWTFGASEISVDHISGQLLVDSRTWSCPIRLPAGLTLPVMYQALAGPEPLFTALPGGQPIYESLIDCL